MQKRVSALLFALIGLSAHSLRADVLTWEDCVRETAQKNPDVAADRAALARAEAVLAQQYAPFLPSITGRLSVTRANSPTSFSSLGQTGGNTDTAYDNALTAQYNLFSGFADVAQVRVSRADREFAAAQLAGSVARVSQELKNAFAQMLFAQDQTRLTQSIAARRESNVRLIELRYQVGRENKGSYLRTRADHRAAQFDVVQASRTLRVARRELGRVMGRGDYEVLIVTGTFQTRPPDAAPDFRTLARHTPAFRQADAQRRRADAGRSLALSGFSPALDASASGSRSGDTWPPERERWSLGATLSIPFFSGGRTFFDARRAAEERRRAAFALESADTRVQSDLEAAYANVLDAAENVAIQAEFEDAAVVRAQIARGQYANGLYSFLDWDLIESELITRQKAHLAARRDALLAEAAWEQTQGEGAIRP